METHSHECSTPTPDNNSVQDKVIKEVVTRTHEIEITIKFLGQVQDITYADGSTKQSWQYSSHVGVTSNRDDLTDTY